MDNNSKQLDIFDLIRQKEIQEENDPCDRCNKPYCYGCKYSEGDN